MARFTGEECGRTSSDVNADKRSLMKQFALGVKVGRTKKSFFDLQYIGLNEAGIILFKVYLSFINRM